jgi:hypothetical protein
MIYLYKDKIKSIVLALLILASIAQVGILWVYQNHKFPFNFLSAFFDRNSINVADIVKKAREEIFLPHRIVVSNGNGSYWLIKEDEDIFLKLWNEAEESLKRILNSSSVQPVDISTWDNMLVKKGFLFEFKAGIQTSIIRWFLNITGISPGHPENIQKILILPDEDINKNNTVYILSEKNLYKYVLPFIKNDMSQEEYNKIIRRLEGNKSLVQYSIIKKIDPDRKFPFQISPDVLCVVTGPKFQEMPGVTYYFGEKSSDIEEIASIILANEKESYDRYIDKNNTLVFKNLNNTYRLYVNGLLEYRYIPGAGDQEKGDIGSAFEKVYIYISRIKNYLMNTDARLSLTRIKDDNPNYYEFIFDYIIDGYPIYISDDINNNANNNINNDINNNANSGINNNANNDINSGIDNNTKNDTNNNAEIRDDARDKKELGYKNAVSIKVNANRIIESNWNLINFGKTRDRKEYIVYFEDMLNEISNKYNIQNLGEFAVKNIIIAYVVDSSADGKTEPAWIVEKPDGSYYSLHMIQKEDG